MDNKDIFAHNLKRIMALKDKNRRDISETLGISYFTVSDWVNGKKYPRMDKVEMLARYFGVSMSDLIESPKNETKSALPDEPKLTESQRLMLDLFDRVPEDKQKMVLEMIRVALKTQEQFLQLLKRLVPGQNG